ncbi:MAG: S8 family serine peptidase, partial [Gammaproteobacteria bacterium]|nr:S8 family serine peptidase [Gammaproteobacteria bacterium]
MRRLLAVFFALGGLVLALPATAIEAQTPAVPSGTLELADDSASPNGGMKTYIVQFKLKPGIAYDGGMAGYAATAPTPGAAYDPRSSAVQMYTRYLSNSHDRMLKTMNARNRKLYSYTHTLNGFAARLSTKEVDELRGNKEVLAVWEDYATDLNTNNSADFLGLHDRREGLHRRQWLKGEDVIVGILDSGIVPNHPSFSDTRDFPLPSFCDGATGLWERICDHLRDLQQRVVYDAPPADWMGECVVGEGWTEDDCNNKLIGARFYVDGFLAGRGSIVDGEFLSPRDSSGHGSHTASTAAGNSAVKATFNGTPLDFIEGMAPRARVAVYKVCWLSPGATNFSCFFSDSAAATDQAVADGVHVINFSVGTAASFTDPQDLAFLNATAAGVFVARSGGNSGPGFATINAGEPWVTSVAASTLSGTGFALAATVNAPAAVAGEYTALE